MYGSAHDGAADRDTVLFFPPLAIFSLAGLGVGFQERWDALEQSRFFLWRPPRDGAGPHMTGLPLLLEVPFDGCP